VISVVLRRLYACADLANTFAASTYGEVLGDGEFCCRKSERGSTTGAVLTVAAAAAAAAAGRSSPLSSDSGFDRSGC